MGVRTVRPRMALSISMYILQHGGPPADGGHPGHPGGRHSGGRYTADGHADMLTLWGKEDTEGAPT
jgi:hypothetical protein